MPKPRALVAMSGGVDSSVAAALLVEKGYDVLGVTMSLVCYGADTPSRPCCSADSIRDAGAVAAKLGIRHEVLDLSDSFEKDVIHHFVLEYERGRTPIPCVRCNSLTKFKDLLAYADDQDCEYIATGHYAIVQEGALYRGKDLEKDQTYFLWAVDGAVIQRLLLPLGHFTKTETRRTARRLGFGNAERTESVEICFVPEDDYAAVLEQRLAGDSQALAPGPIVDADGKVVGQHDGYARYTIGQRRGLPGGYPQAMYVTQIRPDDRSVVIGTETDLMGRRLRLGELNWLAPRLDEGDRCLVSTRYRSRLVEAVVAGYVDGNGDSLILELAEEVRAITPGQSGVLYDSSDRLLGGGVIQ